jgi:hypothetical protein
MYAAYLDESYDGGNNGLFVVAAILGDGWRILKGEVLWKKLLDKYGMVTFKASNLKQKPDVVTEFTQAIIDSKLVACGIIAIQALVRKHLAGSALHKQYKESPYMLLYQHAFVVIAMDLHKHNAKEAVAFVCDENARYLNILARSYPELRSKNRTAAVYMGSCSTEKDEECVPLQMADLISNEIRRAGLIWDIDKLSDPLRLLMNWNAIWSIRHLDENHIKKVRMLVERENPL